MLWKVGVEISRLRNLIQRDEGQALFEYSLVITLVALVAVAALTALGLAILGFFGPLGDIIGG
jgi:Flp pilus assembly pilin Flp